MFVIFDKENMKVPVKVWLDSTKQLDDMALEQTMNLSRLPFVHKWVSLMPDTHAGMGMPIGGVLPAVDVIIPNAVGVDIGCGMGFISTNIPVEVLRDNSSGEGDSLLHDIIDEILQTIPLGFNRFDEPQPCYTMDKAIENIHLYEDTPELLQYIDRAYYQVGTLGGGNHFIELQQDQEGKVCIMVHSGSRNFGLQVCEYFNKEAEKLNRRWYSQVPSECQLAFLPVHTDTGQQYINWMNLALDYAFENREKMIEKVKSIVEKWVGNYTDFSIKYDQPVFCHHNYASLENHYDKNVWVHRKGATQARDGQMAVIPGAMGSYSYLVMGLGNKESFDSCSHGAGREYSRRAAMQQFQQREVMDDLREQQVVLGKHSLRDVAEESRFAYKDIEEVMGYQRDLVHIVKELKTIGVVKG